MYLEPPHSPLKDNAWALYAITDPTTTNQKLRKTINKIEKFAKKNQFKKENYLLRLCNFVYTSFKQFPVHMREKFVFENAKRRGKYWSKNKLEIFEKDKILKINLLKILKKS